jgi:hypothetical protein
MKRDPRAPLNAVNACVDPLLISRTIRTFDGAVSDEGEQELLYPKTS